MGGSIGRVVDSGLVRAGETAGGHTAGQTRLGAGRGNAEVLSGPRPTQWGLESRLRT